MDDCGEKDATAIASSSKTDQKRTNALRIARLGQTLSLAIAVPRAAAQSCPGLKRLK